MPGAQGSGSLGCRGEEGEMPGAQGPGFLGGPLEVRLPSLEAGVAEGYSGAMK